MKLSSSSRRRLLSLDSVRAEFSTSSEADPVSVAPRLTCMTLAAASCVPCATFWTLRAISCVAELCCSTALAIVEAMSEILPMVPPISLIAATDSCVAPCMPELVDGRRQFLGRRRHRLHVGGGFFRGAGDLAGQALGGFRRPRQRARRRLELHG